MTRSTLASLAAIVVAMPGGAALAQTAPTTPAAPMTAPQPGVTPTTPVRPQTTAPTTAPTATPRTTTTAPTTTPRTTTTAPMTAPRTTTGAPATTTSPATPAASTATTTIGQHVAATGTLSTLAKAVEAAGLTATLAGPGPFTVFAPTDTAFSRLAPGTLDTLMTPEQKPALEKVVQYHVVQGKLDAEALKARIEASGGRLSLNTVAGQPLTATLENGGLVLTDTNNTKIYVTEYDMEQTNGIVHVVNGVLVPKLG